MGLNASNVPATKGSYVPLEPGTYPSRVVGVIDFGLQPQKYGDEVKDPKQELAIVVEFVDEFLKDEDGEDMKDKPRWLTSRHFTLNNLDNEKANSTKIYKSIDPQNIHGGDFAKLIDTPIMTTVINNTGSGKNKDKVYDGIGGFSPMRAKEAEKCPALVNKPFVFDLDDPDLEVFKKFPKFIQEKIMNNLEFPGSPLEKMLDSGGKPSGTNPPKKNTAQELDDDNPY